MQSNSAPAKTAGMQIPVTNLGIAGVLLGSGILRCFAKCGPRLFGFFRIPDATVCFDCGPVFYLNLNHISEKL